MEVATSHQLRDRKRIAWAVLFTTALVCALELVSIYRGSSLAIEIGYFAIPAAVALVIFRGFKARVVSFIALTLLSLLTVAATVLTFFAL